MRFESLTTWWWLSLAFAAAVLAGRPGVSLLMAVASVLALREFFRLSGSLSTANKFDLWLSYAGVVIGYAVLACGWSEWFQRSFPCSLLLLLATFRVLQGETVGYIRITGTLFWGVMVLGYGLGHSVLLLTLPQRSDWPAGSMGLFVYLIVLTQINDIAQALIGRRFGSHNRHRITPRVSPNKTWEGFLGGLLVAIAVAVLLGPRLTPFDQYPLLIGGQSLRFGWIWAVLAGLLIAISGFLGDVNMSAVKRDAGAKDSSNLLPGMGGMIDRIDSLTFAAPVFYYYVLLVTQSPVGHTP